MTGFIKGLFGRKQQEISEVQPQQKGAYFLNPDDSKTFGDIDYMRSSKTVKRTFAKGDARVRQISALKDEEVNENQYQAKTSAGTSSFQSTSQPKTSTFSSGTSNQSQKKTAGSSMDMFRNMAKEIRKR